MEYQWTKDSLLLSIKPAMGIPMDFIGIMDLKRPFTILLPWVKTQAANSRPRGLTAGCFNNEPQQPLSCILLHLEVGEIFSWVATTAGISQYKRHIYSMATGHNRSQHQFIGWCKGKSQPEAAWCLPPLVGVKPKKIFPIPEYWKNQPLSPKNYISHLNDPTYDPRIHFTILHHPAVAARCWQRSNCFFVKASVFWCCSWRHAGDLIKQTSAILPTNRNSSGSDGVIIKRT